jgi:hypothetical protein|tara:strand:- start:1135 stop:1374 length:240 start_codon:yes stop_codon:yes gene_type:complete
MVARKTKNIDVHSLDVQYTELKVEQGHIASQVQTLGKDMKVVKKSVFQAKWMLIGGFFVILAANNSQVLASLITMMGTK